MRKLSLLLVPAVLAACSMGTASEPMPAPAPAPAPAMNMSPAGFPTGAYTITLVQADLASVAADMAANMVGTWVIDWGANGHALVTYGGRQVVDATYTVSGDELALGEDSGDYACHANARYRWHATATELHLTKVEDPCDGRSVALTAHALVRR